MKHVTKQEIQNYYLRTLQQEEELALLNHVAQCSYCAGHLAASFPEEELITPPPDLAQQIVHFARRTSSHRKPKREFYFYTARVILAMGMSLFLLVSGRFLTLPAPLLSVTNYFSIEYNPTPKSILPGGCITYTSGCITNTIREKGSRKQESIQKQTTQRIDEITAQREKTSSKQSKNKKSISRKISLEW